MADNVAITAGAGTTVGADEVVDGTLGTVKVQFVKIMDGTLDSTTKLRIAAEDSTISDGDGGILAAVKRNDTPANLSDTDGDVEFLQVSGGKLWVAPLGFPVTLSTDVTRAANTTTYAINDNFGSTPSGGYTITGAGRKSGGSGIILDAFFAFEEDAATPATGEIFLFNTSFTEVADNSAFVISDAEAKTLVGIIPFTLADIGNQGYAYVSNLNLMFTCSGSANLRFAVRAKNAYVPTTNSSVLTCGFKILQID